MINTPQFPTASITSQEVEIFFAIDGTGSLQPCINGVKDSLIQFVNGLQTEVKIIPTISVLIYRDIHDQDVCTDPWDSLPFTKDLGKVKTFLSSVKAYGGGDAPESSLDAFYYAGFAPWSNSTAKKVIIFMSDAPTHPTLRCVESRGPEADLQALADKLASLDNLFVYMICPYDKPYLELNKLMASSNVQFLMRLIGQGGNTPHYDLVHTDFNGLMKKIGMLVSSTTITSLNRLKIKRKS